MDNLTHTLTGLMLSRAGLNRLAPRASWLMILATNTPDIDVISMAGGAHTYLEHHRGITHSLILMPVMAMLPVLAMRYLFRQRLNWVRAYAASLIGVASHIALDFTNPYGIRLFLPWSAAWPGLDMTSVVDLWIWGGLLLAVAAPAISSLVSGEIGARKTSGRGWAVFALLWLSCYDTARFFIHERVIQVQQARVYEGMAPKRVLAFPGHVNPFLWRGFVETDQFWAVHEVNLLHDFDPTQGRLFFKPDASAALDAAGRTPLFQRFMGFSKAPLCRNGPADEPSTYTQVECRDLRFGFAALAVLDERNAVQRTWFEF
jgi:inner membrane protein